MYRKNKYCVGTYRMKFLLIVDQDMYVVSGYDEPRVS